MFKRFSILSMSLFLCIASASIARSQEDVSISLEHVFVPKGFDSNDIKVEIIVIGELPNTCFIHPRGDVKVVNNQITIEMKATKLSGEDMSCIMAAVPYLVPVSLGQLSEGRYNIEVNAGAASETHNSLTVERPHSGSVNNFTYAKVTKITETNDDRKIIIEGFHPSSCMEISRVDVITNERNDTYSVLPILKQVEDICDRRLKPFVKEVTLPAITNPKKLAHIRTIDGTALNYLLKDKEGRLRRP